MLIFYYYHSQVIGIDPGGRTKDFGYTNGITKHGQENNRASTIEIGAQTTETLNPFIIKLNYKKKIAYQHPSSK